MPLELNALRMAAQEWENAEGRHAKHRAEERLHKIARPALIITLLIAYDEATEDAQRLRDRYEGQPVRAVPVQQEGGD
jgi:hypothetical protein